MLIHSWSHVVHFQAELLNFQQSQNHVSILTRDDCVLKQFVVWDAQKSVQRHGGTTFIPTPYLGKNNHLRLMASASGHHPDRSQVLARPRSRTDYFLLWIFRVWVKQVCEMVGTHLVSISCHQLTDVHFLQNQAPSAIFSWRIARRGVWVLRRGPQIKSLQKRAGGDETSGEIWRFCLKGCSSVKKLGNLKVSESDQTLVVPCFLSVLLDFP